MATAAQNVYGGLAQIGQIKAQIGLGIAVCLALSLCVSGGVLIKSTITDKHTTPITATLVASSSCSSNTCPAVASYSVNGKKYTLNGQWANPLPSTATIAYDPANPGDSEQNPPSFTFSIILMVAAICIVIIGFIIYKLTMTYKPIAALEGADAVYNIGKTIL